MAETIKGITVTIGADTTGLSKALSDVNKKSKDLQSELKQVEKLLKLDPTNTELLAQKQKLLSDAITNTSEKLSRLKSVQEQVNQQFARGEISEGQYRAFQREIVSTEQKLKSLQSELGKTKFDLDKIGESFQNVGDKISKVGKTLTTDVSAPIAAIGTVSAKSFMDFSDGLAKISTVAGNLDTSMDKLGKDILKLSNDTGQAATDIQEGLYDAISAGVDATNAMDFMGVAVRAAKGGFTDTKTAVDGLTTTLNAYGLEASKATEIANQMMVAQNLGKTTFGEMAAAIGNVIPTAASLGIKTNELFGSLAALTANGIKTSEAVTGLKAAFSNIVKPSSEAAKEAERLGIQFNAAHLQAVGWGQFLSEIQQKTGGNTETMSKLFGSVEALNTVLTLTSDQGMGLFNESLQQMNDGTNYVDEAFNKVSSSSGQSFKNALNELSNAGIELGNSLTPVIQTLADLIKGLAGTIQSLTPQQKEMLVNFALIAAAVGPVLFAVGKVISIFGDLIKAFKSVGDVVKGAGAIFSFLTSPIGLVVLAVGALITIGWLVVKNWDSISKALAGAWKWLQNTASSIFSGIGNFFVGLWNGIKNTAINVWNSIVSFLGNLWNGLSSTVGRVFGGIRDGIVGAFDGAKKLVLGIWDGIVNGIKGAINWIINGINTFIRAINSIQINVPSVDIPGVGKVGGFAIGLPDIPEIPKLASGGIVTSPTLAMIGEAGPEAVVPLDRYNQSITVIFEIDGRQIAKKTVEHMPRILRLKGAMD